MRVVCPPVTGANVTITEVSPLPPILAQETLAAYCADPSMASEPGEDTSTALGWPCHVVRGRRGEAWIMRCFVQFLDHGALVEIAAPSEAARASAWESIAAMRPDWSDEPATLGQLFR